MWEREGERDKYGKILAIIASTWWMNCGYCAILSTWYLFKLFHNKNFKKGRVHLSSQEHSGNANINIWQMNVVNTEEQLNSTKQFTWKCHFKPQNCTLYFSCVSAFWKKKCRKTLISSKSVCLLGKMLV